MKSVDLMSLWNAVCSVLLCSSVRNRILETCGGSFFSHAGDFFSHRAHRVHGAFWRTVSSPQKAFGIQSSQNVIAKCGCKVL